MPGVLLQADRLIGVPLRGWVIVSPKLPILPTPKQPKPKVEKPIEKEPKKEKSHYLDSDRLKIIILKFSMAIIGTIATILSI